MSDNLIIKKEIWIVGAGPMAMEHARAALRLGIKPVVIGRGHVSAKVFEEELKIPVVTGGMSTFLQRNEPSLSTYIIIAIGSENLIATLLELSHYSFAGILIEKPGAISIEELIEKKKLLKNIEDRVFIAYNRRFYSSVIKALNLIHEDGGLQTMHFDFTEWSHKIEPLQKAPGVKKNWFFANSTHVIDLAFFIAGTPLRWQAFSKKGSLDWHKNSFYSGAGVTDRNVLFSYHSNWESAGRWSIELLTENRKLILCPLEELKQVKRGHIEVVNVDLKVDMNLGLKAGILLQLKSFLSLDMDSSLINLKEQICRAEFIYGLMNASKE